MIGIDLGAVRIGVAISNAEQTMAGGLRVLTRDAHLAGDHRAMARIVSEETAVGVVVGLPLSLDASVGPAAQGVLDELELLTVALDPTAVETSDERFSTASAYHTLRASLPRAKQARALVDQVAAAVLLQSWLDRRRAAQSCHPAQSRELAG